MPTQRNERQSSNRRPVNDGGGSRGAGEFRISFGKYRGDKLYDIPTETLEYYLQWDGLYPEQRKAIEAYLESQASARPTEQKDHRSPVKREVPKDVDPQTGEEKDSSIPF